MLDQHALISRLEAADTEELIRLVTKPDEEEEKVLRTYLGSECFQRLHGLALRREMMRTARATTPKCNVVVIPGTLGSELSMCSTHGVVERIWLSPRRIVAGQLERLTLDPTGLRELDPTSTVHASGMMKRYYGELLLTLAQNCNVHAFWYDWRKDLQIAAAQLQAKISHWFTADERVHLVAHGAGGLVARAHMAQYPEQWTSGGRLIMLGTPNYGLFTAVQGLTGHLLTLRYIDRLDTWHNLQDFRTIVQSFPSLYQLLPSPLLLPDMATLYRAETYGSDLKVSQQHLDHALNFHKLLSGVADPKHMVYISGEDQPTVVGIDLERFHQAQGPDIFDAFPVGLGGDGNVPHRLGLLRTEDDETIPTFFVKASHGQLLTHPSVLNALNDLLSEQDWHTIGERHALRTVLPAAGRGTRQPNRDKQTKQRLEETWLHNEQQLDTLVRRVSVRSGEPVERPYITAEERTIEEILTSGFFTGLLGRESSQTLEVPFAPPEIQINLICSNIVQLDSSLMLGTPIDAIAVGHYLGSKPEGAMKALDEQISTVLDGYEESPDKHNSPAEKDLLLTQFTQRGTITSGLAQIFLLNDPRKTDDATGRTLVVAGMGVPGRFGIPELTVLARELCWTLGRIGKRHLATLLIGAGNGNLATDDAVMAWVRGIKAALTGIEKAEHRTLQEITFVEMDPSRVLAIDKALRHEQEKLLGRQQQSGSGQKRMIIHYAPLSQAEHDILVNSAKTYVANVWHKSLDQQGRPSPTRITVGLEGQTYRFGALTSSASIPERAIPLDPRLVMKANDELAAEGNPERKVQLGQFMERLLLPQELHSAFTTTAPLVLMLDATTARIHWELLAQTDPVRTTSMAAADDYKNYFWGTSRGFTRQLRTLFAPPPEPPPAEQRILRVLIVADPAADNPLQGAEEEGIAVADLFERFNVVHADSKNRVEVVRLFGPREATRTAVLRHLMLHTYNVLHFAGHCTYQENNVAASGWIFTNNELLSANELRRIDRVPQFIFSNACESGITPDRSEQRSVGLAPSFAEAFFERGVANFVCTAWPVDDRAARDFALTLYAGLLGLVSKGNAGQDGLLDATRYEADEVKPIYQAMHDARCAIADPPNDIRTWGAYQHYGNPYFQLFDPATMKL